jgi:hypothetical protein
MRDIALVMTMSRTRGDRIVRPAVTDDACALALLAAPDFFEAADLVFGVFDLGFNARRLGRRCATVSARDRRSRRPARSEAQRLVVVLALLLQAVQPLKRPRDEARRPRHAGARFVELA